ncbi:MAG: bifunctional demethylmenaquinone methyltransferase/2-methoxy-6-polyprenyl-1,4-benzoquinol methylase UbiE [Bradyrhizobium sp.]
MQAPHPPLKKYYSQDADRSAWLRRLFDRTAADYDRVERTMVLGSGSWYRGRALARAGLGAGQRVLDVGVGTGLTARQAAGIVGSSGRVMGIDPSSGMLERAQVPSGVELRVGSAEALPVASACMDFVSMGYALRHVDDLATVFGEFLRVLVPGGRVCILEITAPQAGLARSMLKIYMHRIVPALSRCIAHDREVPTLMRYYWDTIEACARPATIMAAMQSAGFSDVRHTLSLGIFSEYYARKPPEWSASTRAADQQPRQPQ